VSQFGRWGQSQLEISGKQLSASSGGGDNPNEKSQENSCQPVREVGTIPTRNLRKTVVSQFGRWGQSQREISGKQLSASSGGGDNQNEKSQENSCQPVREVGT